MFTLVSKEKIAENVFEFDFKAPRIAKARKPGQFIVLRVDRESERIPLTIVDSDPGNGTIKLIVQVVGKTTQKLSLMNEGDKLKDLLGPLGKPTHIEKYGKVVAIGGGVGIAPLFPIVKGMTEGGNEVISVLGARSKGLLILEGEMKKICKEVRVVTDDGSYGEKGLVTDALIRIVEEGFIPDLVIAIGPLVMMKAVSELTKKHNLKTVVSLNPIMVDGTGMCGGCRVDVGGKVKFACVDGPEFDGHLVDFKKLSTRLRAYKHLEEHSCRLFKEKAADK